MGVVELTRIGLQGGRYEGVMVSPELPPVIEAVHRERVIGTAEVSPAEGDDRFRVVFELPGSVVSDGVQVVSLRSAVDGEVLDRITLMAGSAIEEDVRAELALVRDELEMLKRVFRRHCAETEGD